MENINAKRAFPRIQCSTLSLVHGQSILFAQVLFRVLVIYVGFDYDRI